MNIDGTGYTNVYSFGSMAGDGNHPGAGLTLVGSTLYGTTIDGGSANHGTIFTINSDGTGYAKVYDFGLIGDDGCSPRAALTRGDGALYGMASEGGMFSQGTIFAFPIKAARPNPADKDDSSSVRPMLAWASAGNGVTYDVYVNGLLMGNQAATNYDAGTLATNTTYFWRVDVRTAIGVTTGDTWTFTTGHSQLPHGWFEDGDFTGWTLSGNTNSSFVTEEFAHTGTYGAALGAAGTLGYLSQSFATISGQAYVVSCWLDSVDGLAPNEFSVAWNGATLFDRMNVAKTGWTNLQFVVLANSPSSFLQFGFRDDPAYFGLADISVKAYADNTAPTLTVTSAPPSRVTGTNASIAVSGTARDNVGISSVWMRINGSDWVPATGTTNWNLTLQLAPGLNTILAYGVDFAGNHSSTSSVVVTFLPTSMMTVQLAGTGRGTLSTNYNGQQLIINSNYTMTANPTSGSAFTNWTYSVGGDVVTNGRVIRFTMVSNLVLYANFADVTAPTLTIARPAANQKVYGTNANVVVSGTVSDNVAVASVQVRVNGGEPVSAAGTNAWIATVSALAGGNTVLVYSVDNVGNVSTAKQVVFSYIPTAVMTVQLAGTGKGTLSTNYNGQQLIINSNYTMTATATPGSVFTNWTYGSGGPLATTNRSILFTMAPNLVLCANFADATIPTVSITSPTANQKVYATNANVMISGTASDNVAVVAVLVQLNGGAPVLANGTNAWNTTVSALTGVNTVLVYSVDNAAKVSTNKQVVFTLIPTGLMTVQTAGSGKGTLSTNYNGQMLIINSNYMMTANPASGSIFTNWTYGTGGDVATNGRTIQFAMVSNLVLCANFMDKMSPTVTITNPTASQKVYGTNANVVVSGTASDNVAVVAVQVRLNGGDPVLANGSNAWNTTVSALAGVNTAMVYSVDNVGNISTSKQVVFTFVPTGVMTVQTAGTGRGTLSPNDHGALLNIRSNYTITATAGPGSVFTNWTYGSGGALATNARAITFAMASNLVLCANFVDVTPPTVKINTPVNGQQIVTNGLFSVSGTATDNVGVAAVWVSLNNSDWTLAVGTTTWNLLMQLVPGSNSIAVCSEDAAERYSSVARVVCTNVVTANFTVLKNGLGTVTTMPAGVPKIGQTYTLTAAPVAKWAFVGWNDSSGGLLSTARVLTVIMPSNLVVTANFVRADVLATAGKNALAAFFSDESQQTLDPAALALAATDFSLSVAVDPNNYTNRIYHAVAILLNLVNDPAIRRQAAAYGINLDNLLSPTMEFPTNNAPAINASLDVLAASVLPTVASALNDLSVIPATWTGMVAVTSDDFPSMVQADAPLWIDNGDVTALKAACEWLRAWVALFKAYSLDVDFYRLRDPVPTVQRAITVDGSTNDWVNVPVSLLDCESVVTQKISVAMSEGRIAFLLDSSIPYDSLGFFWFEGRIRVHNQTPWSVENDVTYTFFGSCDVVNGGSVDVMDSFGEWEALSADLAMNAGVLEVELPVLPDSDISTLVTLDRFSVHFDDTQLDYLDYDARQPGYTPLAALRLNNPGFLSRVRDTASMANAKTYLQNLATDYLAADTLVCGRNAASADLMHLINLDGEALPLRSTLRTVATDIQSSLAGTLVKLIVDPNIGSSGEEPVNLSKLFSAPYVCTNLLPTGLTGTFSHPTWTAFPDPTFGGLFPSMTNTKLNQYLRWNAQPVVVPATLVGMTFHIAQSTQDNWNSYRVLFGNGTYLTSGDSDGNPAHAGTYRYTKTGSNTASLVMTPTAPAGEVINVTLTFTSNKNHHGTFVSGDATGVFNVSLQSAAAPASNAGLNLQIGSAWGNPAQFIMDSHHNWMQVGGSRGGASRGTHTYTQCAPAAGMIVASNGSLNISPGGDASYWALIFDSGREPVIQLDRTTGVMDGANMYGGPEKFRVVGALTVTSAGFTSGGTIPKKYAYSGGVDASLLNHSPPLTWTTPPTGAKSFAVLMDDMDADGPSPASWVVYNLPATLRSLPEAMGPEQYLLNGGVQGLSGLGNGDFGYGGPQPPSGETHHYVFTVIALDTMLEDAMFWDPSSVDQNALEMAMADHVLAFGMMTGTYAAPAEISPP